ncbi:MAG: hypothetical protein ABJE47_00630 [bacterium]
MPEQEPRIYDAPVVHSGPLPPDSPVSVVSPNMEEAPRLPRLGREPTPIVLPTSFRVKRSRRKHRRRAMLLRSLLVVIVVGFFGAAFALRNRIRELVHPHPKAATDAPPKARPLPRLQ